MEDAGFSNFNSSQAAHEGGVYSPETFNSGAKLKKMMAGTPKGGQRINDQNAAMHIEEEDAESSSSADCEESNHESR
jgi:hypothetical protein